MLNKAIDSKIKKDVEKKLKQVNCHSHEHRFRIFDSFLDYSMKKTLEVKRVIHQKNMKHETN